MDVPTWLETSLFQRVLQKSEQNKTIEVSSITVKPAVAMGDNYASDMFRVNVIFSHVVEGSKISETKSLIVKVPPQSGFQGTWVGEAGFFEVEIAMMSETLPCMDQVLQSKLSGICFAAQCFDVQREEPIYLIFEDLASRGFRMVDNQAGLDLDHCLLAVRNLAAFHASSVAVVEKNPEVVTKYRRGLFHEDHAYSMRLIFSEGIKSLGEKAAEWPELNPRISHKISKLSDVAYKKTCEVIAYTKNDFNVINHGDFRASNMLFCYDEQGKPINHIFVDFQMSQYGSPALDLLYFFGTNPSENVQTRHRELILHEYHTSLTEIMTKLECNTEAPSFDNLKESLEKRTLYEVVASLTLLPFVLTDKSNAKSLDEIIKLDGTYDNPGYQNKLSRDIISRRLRLYDSRGLLDL